MKPSVTSIDDEVVDVANELSIAGPQSPRAPMHLDDGSLPHSYTTPKYYFHHQYFQACDLLLQELGLSTCPIP